MLRTEAQLFVEVQLDIEMQCGLFLGGVRLQGQAMLVAQQVQARLQRQGLRAGMSPVKLGLLGTGAFQAGQGQVDRGDVAVARYPGRPTLQLLAGGQGKGFVGCVIRMRLRCGLPLQPDVLDVQ